MIGFNKKQISYINFGGHVISKVYYGANIVWQKIKAIIGWVNETPWDNEEPWTNT